MKKRTGKQEQERLRLLRLFEQQAVDEVRLTPGYLTHNQLWNITTKLPEDYEPYGKQDRRDFGDCSCGCRWYHLLAGRAGEDWGVCGNPASHRAGLLTFEHEGCPQFQRDDRHDCLDTLEGQREHQRFDAGEQEIRQQPRRLLQPCPDAE